MFCLSFKKGIRKANGGLPEENPEYVRGNGHNKGINVYSVHHFMYSLLIGCKFVIMKHFVFIFPFQKLNADHAIKFALANELPYEKLATQVSLE